MKEVVIIDAVRTPIGKANGFFRNVYSDELGVAVVKALLKRNPFDHNLIEDVIFGCVMQQEEQGFNVARQILLGSGLPVHISATTTNRLCGSSLQAINQATQAIIAGIGDIYIAGGLEHMTHIPMGKDLNFNPKLFKYFSKGMINMGITAELLSVKYDIPRDRQDIFAFNSHMKASSAQKNAKFKTEIIPVYGHLEDDTRSLIEKDQGVREDTSIESLAKLMPAFNPKGTITAGNASQISDGASALLVMSMDKAKELNLKPIAKLISMATAGVDPSLFGIGPVYSTEKALKRANLSLKDIDVIELNEAFAVQALTVVKELNIDENKLNLNGGAIALGHPLGCSGARITTTLLHIMQDRKLSLGLSTMCIGLGQGITTIFESL
ncbi:MAG: acetyl-CoA C-acyltransferase [Spirochaetota bacterium]|nr:acetyl-CoA C-acyltransferase [Spirochaetota bacterium]